MYKIINDETIQRLEGALYIPRDEANVDYQEFLQWEASGGVVEPPEPASEYVPTSVSRYQARAALLEADLLTAVEAYFAELPDSSLEKLAWKEAPNVNRDSSALTSAADALGLTGDQVDALFRRAILFV